MNASSASSAMLPPSASSRPALEAAERRTLGVLAAVGVATAALGAVLAPQQLWAAWLLVSYYVIGLGLAGGCFVAIQYTTGSSWCVAIRRVPEAMAGTLPLGIVMLALLLILHPQLYPWMAGGVGATEGGSAAFRQAWLSRPFFLARAAVYAAIWILFTTALRRRSLRQDADGDPRWTRANVRWSAAFLAFFGATFTLASVDWIMSLEPRWYSTIFGAYNFAGLFLSGLAAIILLAIWLERRGPLQHVLTGDHLHDLGKLLFAFSTFWMYLWFSQYMLIWYTDIPEETAYFVRRVHGIWLVLLLANILCNWLVPFFVLLRRDTKRRRDVLAAVAAIVLAGRWLDVYLMIAPGVASGGLGIGLWAIGLTAGGAGAFGLALARTLRGAPAVPVADPQLAASLQYEH